MNTYGMHMIDSAHAALGGAFLAVVLAALACVLVLEGFALWYAARNRQWAWFVIFLLVHTLILEAVYLIWFREDKNDRPIAPPPVTPPASISSAA